MLRGSTVDAIRSFDRAIALDPSLGEAHLNRGIALMRADQNEKAAAELQALANDGNSPLRATAAYHAAIALDRLGHAADAETWLSRALTLDPALDAAMLYSGFLRERRGDLQGAGHAYNDYLKAHPDSVVALLRFGVCAQAAGHADVAKTYLARVIALQPESMEAVEARKYLVMWE